MALASNESSIAELPGLMCLAVVQAPSSLSLVSSFMPASRILSF
jgi:hypothetical protein